MFFEVRFAKVTYVDYNEKHRICQEKFIFSKRFLAVFLGIFQITLFFVLVTRFYTVGSTIYSVLTIISVGIMLYLFER